MPREGGASSTPRTPKLVLSRHGVLDHPLLRMMTLQLARTSCPTLTPRPQIPTKASPIAAVVIPRSKENSMSLPVLESTINSAFDARDGISTAAKGEVRA